MEAMRQRQTPASSSRPSDEPTLIYVGNSRGMERRLMPQAGLQTYFIPMAPPDSMPGLALLAIATLRSLILLLRIRPRLTFATGGYVSVPAAIASWLLRIPLLLFLPDVVPGRAVAWLVPLARQIAVSTEDAVPHLPAGKTIVTGYPVRDSFAVASRQTGRARFNLPVGAMVVCVLGGSQGARSINRALARHLPHLLSRYYVLHVCGDQRLDEAEEASAGLSLDRRARYRLYPYLHSADMASALAAANLVLCRSGASVLGELPAVGTPAVLVPFPDPAVHQRENAAYLVERGAAVTLDDAELSEQLGPVVDSLLGDPARLEQMALACRALARPDAAAAIARLIAWTGL